jgi:cobalt-zinc-cadmium efflux system outer membrane protein
MAAKATMKICASLQVRTRWTALLILTCGMAAAAQAPPSPTPGPNSQATPAATGKKLTLQEAFSRADKQNLDLAAARLRRAVALAGIIIAGQRPNPTISVSVTRDLPHESVFIDQPLELGSKRSSRIGEANQEVALSDVEISTAGRHLRRQVRDAFFAAALASGFTAQQKQLVDLAQKLRDIAQSRFDAGDVPQLEVMQADLELARAKADYEVAGQEQKVAFTRLSTLLNEPASTSWDLVTPLDTAPPQVALQDLIARASDANPELQHLAKEAGVELARERVFRAERIPEVTAELGGDFNAPPDYRAALRGQLTVGLPIFSRYQGELAQSSATQKMIEGEIMATRRSVAGDVEAAYNEFVARQTEVDLYSRTVIPAGRKLESLAEDSYRAGRTSILAVLDAQRTVQQNERDYLQSLFELQQAFADLEEIVGAALD